MGERRASGTRPAVRTTTVAVDVAILAPMGTELAVLVQAGGRAGAAGSAELPWDGIRPSDTLDDAADRIARAALGFAPAWLGQCGTWSDTRRHPGGARTSVGYLAVCPGSATGAPVGENGAWVPMSAQPSLMPRQRAVLDAAAMLVQSRIDQSPLAFRFLPAAFTLSELQAIYELLLDRKLHKASFRRALHAARLVAPLDEWRSEGRGRPAQLFQYAPARRRSVRRAVRFDLIAPTPGR